MSETKPAGGKPRKKRRREDRSEWPMSTFLPKDNPTAGRAYLYAIIGLIPLLGAGCGPVAIVLGRVGWERYKANPEIKGGGHAMVGIVLGTVEMVANFVGGCLIAFGWAELKAS